MKSTSSPGNRPLRILIVRIGAMGDVLHAMPAVAALRERHPDSFIGWAIEPVWSELLEAKGEPFNPLRDERRPLVDRRIEVPTRDWKRRPASLKTLRDIASLRQRLRTDHYDVCVDMQGSIRSAIVARMAAAKIFTGPADPREGPAAWFYRQKIALSESHVIEQGCELLGAAIGEQLQPTKISLPVDAAAERWCDTLLAGIKKPFAWISPAAGWGSKQWPAEQYGAVAAALAQAGYQTLINAFSADDAIAARVVEASAGAATLVPCSIGQMIAAIRRAGVVLGGDTGPIHLAAALERPVVSIFGPTDPARTGPYATRMHVLRHPSSQNDHTRLQDPEHGLMQIGVDAVVDAALELLQAEQDKVKA
jgi:heptosyltransferase-1